MKKERSSWSGMRFGKIDEGILGSIDELKEINWPDYSGSYTVNDKILTYSPVRDIRSSAERIAEIFRKGAYEMVNNRELEWHHHPEEIIEKFETGDWNFYGCYFNDVLIAAESLFIIRGDSVIEWVWGCVDPPYRGLGVWQNIGIYTDMIVEMSGARPDLSGLLPHTGTPRCLWRRLVISPWDVLSGSGYTYGGADNRYYRHTLIHYAKLYGNAADRLQSMESMELTENAGKLMETVKNFFPGGNFNKT